MDGRANGNVLSNSERLTRLRQVLLAAGHFVNDLHAMFVDFFNPILVQKLGISLGQAGFLTSIGGLMHACLQPVIGYIADKDGRSRFIIFGPAIAAFFSSMIPLSVNYYMAMAAVCLWGVGTAMFHPQGQGAVGYVSEESNSVPFGISLFFLGGTLGTALGPIYARFLVNFFPLYTVPFAASVLPLCIGLAYVKYIPSVHKRRCTRKELNFSKMPAKYLEVFKKVWPIWIVSFTSDWAKKGLQFSIPFLLKLRGYDMATISYVLFGMMLLSSLSPVVASRAAFFMGGKRTVFMGYLLSAIFVFLSIKTVGMVSSTCLMLGGALMTSGVSITNSLGQERAPTDRSTVSSLTMGLSFGLGGVMVTPLGYLADKVGIENTLYVIGSLPLFGILGLLTIWNVYKID